MSNRSIKAASGSVYSRMSSNRRKQRPIKQIRMIRRRDDQALAVVLLQELQEGVENAPDFHRHRYRPCGGRQARRTRRRSTHPESPPIASNTSRSLPAVSPMNLEMRPSEHDGEQGQPQFTGQRRRRHRLARTPGGSDEQELAARHEAMCAKPFLLRLFQKRTPQAPLDAVGQHHAVEPARPNIGQTTDSPARPSAEPAVRGRRAAARPRWDGPWLRRSGRAVPGPACRVPGALQAQQPASPPRGTAVHPRRCGS